ncbi:MAG: lamin tail domain-containing protein [Bacteroidales bacterium]|nr:lamin tail domain-containing protein [Bacteroidales bacterium]
MKRLKLPLVAIAFLLAVSASFGQTPIYTLDFETAGGYSTSVAEFTDNGGDFFIRTDGSDFGSYVVYNNIQGSFYFAAMDLDGEGATLPLFLDIDDIDISGQSNLVFSVYLAEDDDGTNQDWDGPDYVHFSYDVDNSGSFTNLLWIEGLTAGTNQPPHIDTDFDGIGDGAEITSDFTKYTVNIPVTGSLLDIKIEYSLDSGDEDLAIDDIQISAGTGPAPLDANFSADQTNILEGATVNFTDLTSGGTTPYTYAWDLDGDGQYDDSTDPNPSYQYNTAGTYTVALQITDGNSDVDVETKTDYITVSGLNTVNDLAALRAGTIGELYTVTGEVIITFQQDFRNQKFIQDATAAILIDDPSGIITTVYNVGDGITGITGTLSEFGNMMQFIPTQDPGAANSTGNVITPEEITLADLNSNFDNYESELVKINNVTFADAGAVFANGTVYAVSDGSKAAFNFRTTFYDVDYIGSTIPATLNMTVIPNSRIDGDYITSRNAADFQLTGLPTIEKAVAVSATAIDVYYNIAPSSVNNGDYYMTGSNYTVFSGAAIDGTDPTIVHLTGASPAMPGDLTVDELFDDAYGSSTLLYGGILPVAYTNVNNPGGTISNNTMATFQGIVSANDAFNNVWVSDNSGQYNGVLVYDNDFTGAVTVGDEIVFAGVKDIYSNVTEIKLPILINTLTSGNTPYGPDLIPGSDIDENILPETNPAEAWEGQLVKIENFTVEEYADFDYLCSWADSKATYYFHVGDQVDYHLQNVMMTVGSNYASITGVVDWDYDSLYYRINPRTQADIEVSSNPAVQLAVISVNGGINPFESTDFSVVVQAQDALGNPASVDSDVNFTFTTDGGDLANVVFVTGTATTGTIMTGLTETTVTGVQMSPTGTNVTISANDDAVLLTAVPSDPFDVVEFSIPDIIITEIMQNPAAVSDNVGEWFEVFNNSGTPVDMDGWIVKDDGTNSFTISGTLIVPAYGFTVLGNNVDMLLNGGYNVDYGYSSSFALGNSDDEIVLLLPDGVTEVDRVNYDGGPVWPDPTGSSMVFTGFPTEDNNDGTKWVWSTFREGSYDNSYDDKGSPGDNGYDQIMFGGFKLDLKVYLESPYVEPDSMSNYFRDNGMLPYIHPFNPTLPYYGNPGPKWLFSGYDTLGFVPFLTADWVLIELRDAFSAATATSATMVTAMPALLLDDGTVVSMNGVTPLNVSASFTYGAYVVVWSINHLGILSATPVTPLDGTVQAYDFTTGSGQVYGGAAGYKELSTGVWGMVSGDVNGDQTIDLNDKADGWASEAGTMGGYQGNNLYIDDQVDNMDKNEYWVPNSGMSTQVPD